MRNQLEEILNLGIEAVIKSPLSLTMLKIYSTIYLGGGVPRCCERSQRLYFNELSRSGMQKLEEMAEIFNKTCKLKGDILIYSRAYATHFSNANITDAIAIEGLAAGWLKPTQFEILPTVKEFKKEETEEKQPKKLTKPAKNGEVNA